MATAAKASAQLFGKALRAVKGTAAADIRSREAYVLAGGLELISPKPSRMICFEAFKLMELTR